MIILLNQASGSVAGKDDEVRSRVEAALAQAKLEAEIWQPDPRHDLVSLAQRAVQSGERTIVAGGGDGTINAVACVLMGTGCRLGVLPLGTLNHFSKDLGLPQDLPGAIRALAAGEERRVDVGEVNGRFFLNNSSIGLYPSLVRDRDAQRQQLGRSKWLAFARAFLRVLHIYRRLRFQLSFNGQSIMTRSPFLFIGNNSYSTDLLRIGQRDRLDEGLFDIYYSRDASRWTLLKIACRTVVGGVEQMDEIEAARARELHVMLLRRTRIDVSVDGEVCRMELPLHYRLHPQALCIIGPAPAGV